MAYLETGEAQAKQVVVHGCAIMSLIFAMNVSSEYTVEDQERMRQARRYFKWQFEMARTELGRRVLEVGCGLGNFTGLLLDRELVIATDIEPQCLKRLEARFGRPSNLVAANVDVSAPGFLDLGRHKPDSICCLNVLEHVRDDATSLANMHRVLAPGGTAVLIVPASQALYGPIDRLLGHYRRYSRRDFGKLARSVGFEVVRLRYINSIGAIGWWINAHVLRKTEQSPAQIAFFDRIIVPVLSRLEAAIAPPFGQSMFAVLRKSD